MSQQIPDTFMWDNDEYVFICADNIYSLFDPNSFGLDPTAPHTACWKGFVLHFEVRAKQLYLTKLEVFCKDGVYPTINGIDAICGEDSFYEYNNLDIKMVYTGQITIGQNLLPEYFISAFTGPHSYETTYELYFSDGILTSCQNTSGTYSRF